MKLRDTTKPDDISRCWHNWLSGQQDAKSQRLGQYIWNKHGRELESWPELFYCEDATKAYVMAMLEVIGATP